MQTKHAEAFQAFSATFPDTIIAKWTTIVLAWELDRQKQNPYEEHTICKFII